MDTNKPPDSPVLSISPGRIEIVFTEDILGALAYISKPIEDINEMVELEKSSFSLKEHTSRSEALRAEAELKIALLQRKYEKFRSSPTFLNRLANLYSFAGNTSSEERLISEAYRLSNQVFHARKLAEVNVRRGEADAATVIFNELADSDSYSALRLASFHITDGDFEAARQWVEKAIELNPSGYAERLFHGAYNMVNGNLGAAVTSFRMALEARPNSSVVYTNLGLAYLGLHRADKAFDAFKKAIALDPFNRNALIALADLASSSERDADVVNSLRYFVEFEQRDASVWERLARSLLRLNLVDDCIHALKRQGGLVSSVAVWNNLGVAYAKKGLRDLSMKAFKHAFTLDAEHGIQQDLLVARNATALVSGAGQHEIALIMTSSIIEGDTDRAVARSDVISDIYITHMHSLLKLKRYNEAISSADELLNTEGVANKVVRWIITAETALFGLERNEDGRLHSLLDQVEGRFDSEDYKDVTMMNNLAFAFAEMNRLAEADACINHVSWAVHRHAYITATLGLINIRKGRLDKGEHLYREAIRLANRDFDKNRIRQKMHIEIGKALMATDKKKSRALFERAKNERQGEFVLSSQAKRLLESLANTNK
ncbi:hypothetical protein FCE95_14880 [Luteimonas gilva]|uniref:Tetratricopeptide repeat protein n=1 Tax=Luteimonas gilva TaxID=2572684 RepID=A0A4U5JIL7_9GAMM|nr:tetratricopeptide repeat protein [Luteimonas gilva]TKR29430.1 hypothetical protein FCE95_14880 [Luteimonas gilva]